MGRERELLALFPKELQGTYEQVAAKLERIQEIRLRVGRPVMVYGQGREYYLSREGEILYGAGTAFCPDRVYMDKVLNHICGYSAYAFEEEIRRGFLTVPGGHRIGLAGETVLSGQEIVSMKHLNAMNIRISHQIKGAADALIRYVREGTSIRNVLIISPPGCGKTTLLRDLIRQLSEGEKDGKNAYTVGVVDERSEIGGSFCGEVQNDLGPRTDVLDGCPKEIGMTMLLRSMNPQILAVDEIGTGEDARAIGQAIRSGCYVIATIHGDSIGQLEGKHGIGELLQDKVFERYVILGNRKKPGRIDLVLDQNYQRVELDENSRDDFGYTWNDESRLLYAGTSEGTDTMSGTGNLAL